MAFTIHGSDSMRERVSPSKHGSDLFKNKAGRQTVRTGIERAAGKEYGTPPSAEGSPRQARVPDEAQPASLSYRSLSSTRGEASPVVSRTVPCGGKARYE